MNTSQKILFVDDDANLLAAFQRNLRRQFAFDTAVGGPEGLELLRAGNQYAMFVVDMRMPGMDGIEFLEQARKLAPDAVRMMLTGNADQQTAVDAVNRGQVFRFLNKPCPPEVLIPAIENGLKQYEMQRMERELLEGTLTGSVKVMADVLGMVMPEALGRGQRLRESMRQFALAIDAGPVWELEIAALLSPLGYASLPTRVLQKLTGTEGPRWAQGSELTKEELAVFKKVPQIGHDLLVRVPRLANVARIVLYQNKWYDGGGYPSDGVSGENIPLGARMLKVLGDRLTLEIDGVVKQRALETMRATPGLYDIRLLNECFAVFPTFLSNAISADHPVRTLYVKDLVPEQVVVSDITTLAGVVLVGSGHRLTEMVLERLRNYEILGEVKQPVLVQDPAPQKTANAA
jgi:response regulator RpfG family c-di-GMP phosphodiesterase